MWATIQRTIFVLAAVVTLSVCQLQGQQLSLSVIPKYSLGATIPANYSLVAGSRFLETAAKSNYQGTLLDANGNESEYNQRVDGLELDFMLKYTDPANGNSWGLLAGVFQNKYLQYISFPSFDFKGNTVTGHYNFYRATGLSLGLRKVFMRADANNAVGWYAQLNVMSSLQFKTLGTQKKWDTMQQGSVRYVESGTGATFSHANIAATSLVIMPEIGYVTRGDIGFEMSLSYQMPLSPVFTKQVAYYQSNRVSGIEQANITQQSIWFNLKVPISIFKFDKNNRPRPRTEPIPRKREPKPVPPVVQKTPDPVPVEISGKSVGKGETIVLNDLQFDQGQSELSAAAMSELDQVADLMRKSATLTITLLGHTSNEGDSGENLRLSKDRVTACKRYLMGQVQNGNKRIKTVGYGQTRPLLPNSTPENRAKNRRVELLVESL
jgi:outer membrane protein OmpA-like peptidoglycan-associated protein